MRIMVYDLRLLMPLKGREVLQFQMIRYYKNISIKLWISHAEVLWQSLIIHSPGSVRSLLCRRRRTQPLTVHQYCEVCDFLSWPFFDSDVLYLMRRQLVRSLVNLFVSFYMCIWLSLVRSP